MSNLHTLITGATSGIGLEIARKLNAQGRPLILHGSNAEKLSNLRNEFSDAVIWNHDLRDLDGIAASLISAIGQLDVKIDAYVHSAGIFLALPIKSVTDDSMKDIFSVNVFSVAIILRELISYRVNKKSLVSAVFISSNISGYGGKGMAIYGASKFALDGLMKSSAIELAPRVRINSILPGAVTTPMTEEMLQDVNLRSRLEAQYPMGFPLACNIADAVYFLLSDEAKFINGQQITVDGGRSINMSA